MTQTMTQPTSRTPTEAPVSDVTYDLMQALTSKLEAIEAYEMYKDDAQGEVRELFEELLATDRQYAERILQALRRQLAA